MRLQRKSHRFNGRMLAEVGRQVANQTGQERVLAEFVAMMTREHSSTPVASMLDLGSSGLRVVALLMGLNRSWEEKESTKLQTAETRGALANRKVMDSRERWSAPKPTASSTT